MHNVDMIMALLNVSTHPPLGRPANLAHSLTFFSILAFVYHWREQYVFTE